MSKPPPAPARRIEFSPSSPAKKGSSRQRIAWTSRAAFARPRSRPQALLPLPERFEDDLTVASEADVQRLLCETGRACQWFATAQRRAASTLVNGRTESRVDAGRPTWTYNGCRSQPFTIRIGIGFREAIRSEVLRRIRLLLSARGSMNFSLRG